MPKHPPSAPLRAQLRASGFAQAARFSWEASARQLLAIYAALGA
jgi:glycosyltransferase involved in cell wall biosynthesis